MPTPTRLLSRLRPIDAARPVAQDLEDRERPPQHRVEARLRLDHHELSGPRRARDLRRARARARCSRTRAACWRSPRRRRRTSMRGSKYSAGGRLARAAYDRRASPMRYLRMLTQRDRRRRARRRVSRRCSSSSSIRRCRSSSTTAAALVRRAARVLRPVPERRGLSCCILVARGARVAAAAARLAQRAPARVAQRGRRRRGRGRSRGRISRVSRRCSARAPPSACARAPRPRRSSRSCSSASRVLRYSFGRRGSRAAAALAARVDGRCRSSCRSGCAGRASCRCRPARPIAQPPPVATTPPRVRMHSARRRVARTSSASASPPASCRTSARLLDRGADDRSGDAQADAGRAGLGRGGHGQVPAEERHPLERHLPRARRRRRSGRPAARLLLCAGAAVPGLRRATSRVTSASLRARPLWDILADYGVASGIVELAADAPGARRSRATSSATTSTRRASSPLRLGRRRRPAIRRRPSTSRARCSIAGRPRPWHDVLPGVRAGRAARRPGSGSARWDRAYARGRGRARAAVRAAADRRALRGPRRSSATRICATRSRSCSASPAAPIRARSVLDRYYAYIDARDRHARCAQLAPGDLLLVVSGFGMEPDVACRSGCSRGCSASPSRPARTSARPTASCSPTAPTSRRGAVPPRRHRRSRADGALLHGPARRPRHGRLRAHGPVSAQLHASSIRSRTSRRTRSR